MSKTAIQFIFILMMPTILFSQEGEVNKNSNFMTSYGSYFETYNTAFFKFVKSKRKPVGMVEINGKQALFFDSKPYMTNLKGKELKIYFSKISDQDEKNRIKSIAKELGVKGKRYTVVVVFNSAQISIKSCPSNCWADRTCGLMGCGRCSWASGFKCSKVQLP